MSWWRPPFQRKVCFAGSCVAGFLLGAYVNERWPEVTRALLPRLLANAASSDLKLPDDLDVDSLVPVVAAPPTPAVKSDVPSRVSQIMAFGYPGFDNLRTYEDFVVSYDRRNRTAHWVMEHLTPDRMVYHKEVDRSKCTFSEDKSVHPFFRSTNDDYKGSGFDRGHLAPAGNHRRSQNAISQTFLLSNMAPQVGAGFNRGKWNELEKHVRGLARRNRNVYICTGPLYLPRKEADNRLYIKYQVIGPNHVAVPTHFFKVILYQAMTGDWFLESYVLPNQSIDDRVDLKSFHVSLESIERAAGFLIFEKLREQNIKPIDQKPK